MTGSSSSIPTFGIPPHRKAGRHHIGGARFCAALEKNWKKKDFLAGDSLMGRRGVRPLRNGPPTVSVHPLCFFFFFCLSVCLSCQDRGETKTFRILIGCCCSSMIILYYSAHTSCRPTKCAVNERPPLHQFTTVFKVKREYLISRRQLENL